MTTSIIFPSLNCPLEEQGTSSRGSTLIFGNESFMLTHRRSNSNSSNSSTTSSSGSNSPRKAGGHGNSNNHHDTSNIRNGSNSLPASLCSKCHTRITPLFSRFKHDRKSLCTECGLLQKQKAVRRWKKLLVVATTIRRLRVFVTAAKPTLVEDDSKSFNCSVDGKEQRSSRLQHGDHIIHIAPDVKSKFSLNHEPEPLAAAGTSDFIQIEPNLDSQDHDFFSRARPARLVFMCHPIIAKATLEVIKSWVFLKWIFRMLNVLIEVCQATLAQENGQRKLSDPGYQRLSVIISFICLVISLVEIIGEGMVSRAVWGRRGCCCWFYYPGTQRRLFGKFSLYFGVFSSTIQFSINLITLMIKKRFVKFDYLPLLLSFGHLVAAKADPGEQLMVKCRIHGNCSVQCPQCEQNSSALLGGIGHESHQLFLKGSGK